MKVNPVFRPSSWRFNNLLVWPFRMVVLCLLLTTVSPSTFAQEQTPIAEPSYEFVSGTITEISTDRIIVNRASMTKATENRTFIINSDTKVEGKLRPKARVTVGFKPTDEGDVAMRIIVRSGQPSANPKKP